MFATQVLREDLSEKVWEEDDDVEVVGLVLVHDNRYEIRKGETKIGRDPTVCSIVIENFTVSKVHAVIESDGIDDTFIYDVNSTNQTKLGKKVLKPHCRYKLENDSNITLGNITLKFMLPHNISNVNNISNIESKPAFGNFISPNALDDIFEVATQVSVPHPQASGEVLKFEKVPENFQIFKVPNSVDPGIKAKVKEFPGSSEVKNCHLDSRDLVSRTEYCSDSVNTSGIFSLSTQCQIIQPASEEHKPEGDCSGGHKNNESDKIKSLLNDGQDDILCTFMSLHSPNGQAPNELPVKIKTEIVEEDLDQVFDVETQVQAAVHPSGEESVEKALQINEESNTHNSHKPNITSSPINNEFELNSQSSVFDQRSNCKDEDLIKTQEFNAGNPETGQAPQESGECYFENTLDFSVPEENPENEDLICTQTFKAPVESSQKAISEVLENDEFNESIEDFLATQIFDVETGGNETGGKPVSLVVSESPEKDSGPLVEASIDLTQRNVEEDFISTQVFGETASVGNANSEKSGSPGRPDEDDDNEDFIATQPVDLLMSSAAKSNHCQEPDYKIQIPSRESSPDLLNSEFSAKISEDFISTATFEGPDCQSSKTSLSKISEGDSLFCSSVKKELSEDFNPFSKRVPETVESSGDETESDLEIIFDKSDASNRVSKTEELSDGCHKADSQRSENGTGDGVSGAQDNDDSRSSYIFQLEPEPEVERTEERNQGRHRRADDSDSDATDCEEIVVNHKMSIKQEPLEEVNFDETQVLTLTPPDGLVRVPFPNDDCTGKEDSKREDEDDHGCWSQLSLAMPSTQDMEATINKILRSGSNRAGQERREEKDAEYQTPAKIMKPEVGTDVLGTVQGKSKRQADTPLKRPGKCSSEVEAVPTKKSKTETSDRKLRSSEKQFSKLWQAHDIEQIQPSRTRNSLKNSVEKKSNKTDVSLGNNISNEIPTSRRKSDGRKKEARKLSFDTTSYFCKKVGNKRTSLEGKKKETPPKENNVERKEIPQRVLRSSRRNVGSAAPLSSFEPSERSPVSTRSRRSSRLKSGGYFSNPCVKVVFTGFDCESLEKIISDLGGKKTSDVSSGDVVVADKVRRTVKFLSAVGLSLPITSPEWLMSCLAEKRFLNPWDFILKDEESENKWNFELKASLERSAKAKLLLGLSVYATENAKPPVKDLLAIVECCGGTPLSDPPDVWPKKTLIVSCPEDKRFWPHARLRNITIVHYEFILSGVLTQKLDFKTYRLR